jgi:hypothetical protein
MDLGGGIAKKLREVRHHRGQYPRIERGRGVMIEVNWQFDWRFHKRRATPDFMRFASNLSMA